MKKILKCPKCKCKNIDYLEDVRESYFSNKENNYNDFNKGEDCNFIRSKGFCNNCNHCWTLKKICGLDHFKEYYDTNN